MFKQPVFARVNGGVIYTERLRSTADAVPLLCIHGVGGHHQNFALLHAKLREGMPAVVPFFVDVPGFGSAREEALSLRHIESFLRAACTVIANVCGRQVVLFHQSASVWFTLGLGGHEAVYPHSVIAYNPVRIYRPTAKAVRQLLGKNVLDVRHEFLSRFFPPERIGKMDADKLGRPTVPLAFLAQLWRVQEQQPLEGWERAVLIETRADPMREFRVSLNNRIVEHYELDSNHHGISEDAVAQQTASIVQQVLVQC